MPLVRQEIQNFVRVWNSHRIRKQPHRPESISGKPWMLYHHPQEGIKDYGLPPDEEILQNLIFQNSSGNYYLYPTSTQC